MKPRPIEERDLTELADLYVRCFNVPPWNDGWSAQSARAHLNDIYVHPRFVGLVVPGASKPIALAMGHCETWVSGSQYHLQEMCVDPAAQGSGIGGSLLEALVARLREAGVRQVYLETREQGAAAEFYRKAGFKPVEVVAMVKHL